MTTLFLNRIPDKWKRNTPKALLARGAGADLVIRISGAAAGMLLHLVLTRTMGASDYGVFVYVFNWFLLLDGFATLGFSSTIVRFAPAYRARREWSLLRGLLRASRITALLVGIAFALGLAGTVFLLGDNLSADLRRTFYVSCLLIPPAGMSRTAQEILRAFNRVGQSLFPRALLHQVIVASVVGLLWLSHAAWISPPSVMAIATASMATALVLLWSLMRRAIPEQASTAARSYDFRAWLHMSFPMLLTTVFNIANARAGILLTGALLDPTEAGLYAVDNRLSQVLALGATAIGLSFAPIISQLFTEHKHDALQHTVTFATRVMTLLTVPAAVGMLAAGPFLLRLFGPAFAAGFPALAVLVAAHTASAALGPVGHILVMTGGHRQAMINVGIATLLNIGLCLFLIPRWGIIGAAWALLISLLGSRVIMLAEVWKTLRINPTLFRIERRER